VLTIWGFEPHHHPQAMSIVIKAAVALQGGIERFLASMAEWRMAEVVRERERFGEVFIEAERASDDPGDLGNLQAMSQSDPVVIAIGRDENLGLVTQTAKGNRMNDAVAVALIGTARAAGDGPFQRKFAATRSA
jgi:hypothetical protein